MDIDKKCDIAVIGAGHAGCEAALAAARLGADTIIFTLSIDNIAMMPCNPNIGGTSKGHLVREVDALGGEMGKNIDNTFIQSRMLNTSKGPAVHSLRAQADKKQYSARMRKVLENTSNLRIKQAEVAEILIADRRVTGVRTFSGIIYKCKAVILCTGVYLESDCVWGDIVRHTGPDGIGNSMHLSDNLRKHGIGLLRFKTGTPPRIDGRTVDFSKMTEQVGDEKIVPFSFTTNKQDIKKEQISCWLTYTNQNTHRIINENLDRSPLFSGAIKGTGPRYCPSIEDKVVKFPDKDRHQLFIEPEGYYTNEMYIAGMSSSLPEDVQEAMVHTVPGLENAQIVRPAYAIEYDCINPLQLRPSLEMKDISGFFSAGQANGSSGYEEAAAQGIIAGINAARQIKCEPPIVIDRSQAYIGVLIDDLVTKEAHEPYRMMTSRAEYRLLLRQDNADLRLTGIGHSVGLIDDERYEKLERKRKMITEEIGRMKSTFIGTGIKTCHFLEAYGSTPLSSGASLAELLKRPEMNYSIMSQIDPERPKLPSDVTDQVEIEIKYEGYIEKQKRQVEHFHAMENKKIPRNIDYEKIGNLRLEARQKLIKYRPASVGQASRILGVSPADISVLLVYLKAHNA